jgi:hypothetical protein
VLINCKLVSYCKTSEGAIEGRPEQMLVFKQPRLRLSSSILC